MPYVSLSQQQAQFLGTNQATNKPTVSQGYVPLAQQQQTFISTPPQKKQQPKPVVKKQDPKKPDGSYTVNGRTFKGQPGTKDFQYVDKPKTVIGEGARFLIKKIKNLPKATFADDDNFWTPVGFVKHIAQGIVNTPAEAFNASLSIGEHAVTNKSNPKQVAADLATAAQLPLMFVGAGEGVTALKETGKQTLKQTGKQIAVNSLKFGGGFGLLSGIQSGRDIESADQYVTNLLFNVGIGIGSAGILESGTRFAIPLAKGLSNKLGAAFVKVTGKSKAPVIERIQFDPKVAKNMVMTNKDLAEKPLGKEILKLSLEAEKTGQQVVLEPHPKGKFTLPDGRKVEVGIDEVYQAKSSKEMTIKKAASLSDEDRAIESKFTDYVQNNYDEAVERYNQMPETEGGRILNTDTVRELDSSYANDRTKSAAVHEPASAFTKKMYEEKLKEVDPEGRNLVLFTAGGTGAGKSTAVRGVAPQLLEHAQIIYDTNMSGTKSSIEKIEQALKANKEVVLAYVYRDPEEALVNGALPRAMRMGRTVPMEEHLKTHIESTETILKIADHFKNDKRVDIQVIDNSRGKGQAVIADLDLLRDKIYNKDELRQKLTSALNKEYEQNRISEKVYKGFSEGTKPSEKTVSKGAGEKPSANDDKGVKPANDTEGRAGADEPRTVKNFDKSGKEITDKGYKKILTTNEVKAIRETISNKLSVLSKEAKDADDFAKGIDELYNEVIDKSKGDKTVLSALRTELNKEMFGIAGAGGNYREAYATLKTIQKEDPEIGAIIDKFEDYIGKLDDTLITTPDSNYQKPAFIQSKTKVKETANNVESYENPVGTGKLKDSRFFKRLKEQFGDDIPEEVVNTEAKYRALDLEKSAFNAVKIATEEPERALRIADGLEKAPEGMTTAQMRKTVIEIAREKGDWETFNKYSVKTSLSATRAGQEIVSFRGKNKDHNPLAYVDQLVKAQKERIVKLWDKTLLEKYEIDKNASVDAKFKVLVEKQTEKLKQKLTVKQIQIKGAQDIINSLICK